MSDNETFLLAKVQFLAQQLSQAIDALCEANANAAVYRAKVAAAESRIAELESPKGDVNGNGNDHHD